MINDSDIAIIGMSCRFPDANSTDAFWQNLCQAKESVSFFSDEELLAEGVEPALLNDPNYVKADTILPDIKLFDASFFGFTPREAEILDPQHRLFLECAWVAIESAGYDTLRYKGAIGVYAGVGMNRYLLNNLYPNRELLILGGYQLMLGSEKDFLPTRVSYKLNLTGPSVNLQTACSTSLVAVHLACQSLLNGECDIALAGGVSVQIPQKRGYLYQEGMILSPDGHCRAFDASAQGTVAGNGVGIVVLKRFSEAVDSGDTIHAVIKGSAINNDGSLKVSYTAPSVDGQAQVIREAQAVAGVDPETITYIEAHGTGTVLGDPIEIAALTQAFQTQKKGHCAIGSVKTNIGHADAAAGAAGLIKTVLALKHRLIPPTLHFEKPNPKIDFANSPFYVNAELSEWKTGGIPRRAGVSSFGIGGTNAHVVLEEAPPREASGHSRPWQLLVLSAKTLSALDTATTNLAEHLTAKHDNLADVAYTLAKGRQRHPYRRMLLCQTVDEAISTLRERESLSSYFHESRERPIVFMFPGQGSQYVNMAADLYQVEPTFREAVDTCVEILKPILALEPPLSLRDLLYPSQELTPAEATRQLEQTAITQPALFVIEYALAQLWLSWGVTPQAMIGHSIGEYVAATLSGVFSLQDALMLISVRGRLMQSLPKGGMLAVSLPKEELEQALGNALSLAVVNGPSRCVVSGHIDAIEAYQKQLTEQGVSCRRLHTSHAFHSAMMDPILATFTKQVKRVQLHPPEIPYISNVTGTWITAAEATNPTYWAKHLRQTVDLASGLGELLKEPELILLEVGPGRTMHTLAKGQLDTTEQVVLRSLPHPQEEQSDMACLLTTLGQLWIAGGAIDWDGFYAHERRYRLPLPTYPFERQRYWIEASSAVPSLAVDKRQFKRRPMDDWFYVPSWKHVPLPRQALPDHGTWLLFVDDTGLGQQLADGLRQALHNVVTVSCGNAFAQLAEDAFVIDPTNREDYSRVWRALSTTPQKIIHLLNVLSASDVTLIESFYSLLYLAQAIGEHHVTEALELFIIANHLYNVTGADKVQPIKATLLGPTRVLPHEYQNISCRAIDVMWPDANRAEEIVSQLLNEFAVDLKDVSLEKPIVAYRGSRRWLSCVEPIRLPESPIPIRTGGVYLITGGLGGIGLTLAEALASRQTNLVLWGRSGLPPCETWNKWLATHPADDPTSRKIRCVQRIESKGGTVLIQSVDVADAVAVKGAIDAATARFGPFQGVIHAAGIGGDNLIHQTTYDEVQTVLAPKVAGTLVLHELLVEMPLDFFVLCSSLNAFLGALGQVAYTAANAFQDAFAQGGATSYPILSINWDLWREVGMGAYQLTDDNEEDGLSPKEGSQVFFKALGSDLPQLLVSTHDFEQLSQRYNILHRSERAISSQKQRPQMGMAYAPPQNKIEKILADMWQEHVGIDQIGRDDDFFLHLAGDSLSAMSLINRIQDELGAIVHLQAIFEAPTIGQLACYLQEHYADAFQQQPTLAGLDDSDTSQPTSQSTLTPDMVTQVRRGLSATLPVFVPAKERLKPAIFILSPPRVGSTLLRVMLAGHPQLFAPPELGLLMVNTLKDTTEEADPDGTRMRWQGLVRALMQIHNIDVVAAQQQVARIMNEDLPIERIYASLQANINGRLLVDKTPTYGFDPAILRRAEQLFDDAIYIHLLRHPYGMVRSFEEARLDLLNGLPMQQLAQSLSRRQLAEAMWLICNENIETFLRNIPTHRHYRIKFEDLVTEPQTILSQLCHFLNIEFHVDMLDPYQDSRQRMTDGIHQGGYMIGDPKFHQHDGIRSDVVSQWKQVYSEDFLSPMTWSLAERFAYTERAQMPTREPISPSLMPKSAIDPTTLLNQLDQLSDAEIETVLSALLEEQA